MKCFVTGASGFIGGNLVHELNRRGHTVRALLRPNASLKSLAGCDFERVEGSVSDRGRLQEGLGGCDWCFHVAASYHLWLPDYAPMFEANVNGTRNVLECAVRAGCSRVVYTSTVGCMGLPDPARSPLIPSTENTPVFERQMRNPYKLSKWRAEQVALELAQKGNPIVVVNPSAPVGPRDAKPTPTGGFILDFLKGKMPAYLDTGLNWVHVRDVAVGHILAAEHGRFGQRYILGNGAGNWTMKSALDVLSEITGKAAPRFRVPYWVALMAAYLNEALSGFTKQPPKAPVAGVRMARYKMYFDPSKAIHELHLPQTPPRQALSDACDWFLQNGYV